jgi:hypothetical protein
MGRPRRKRSAASNPGSPICRGVVSRLNPLKTYERIGLLFGSISKADAAHAHDKYEDGLLPGGFLHRGDIPAVRFKLRNR